MPVDPFWRDASGRLTFSTDHIPRDSFASVCRTAADALGLIPVGQPLNLIEFLNWKHHKDGSEVVFEWDSWMGFMVTALTTGAEPLVCEIGEWIGRTSSPPKKE